MEKMQWMKSTTMFLLILTLALTLTAYADNSFQSKNLDDDESEGHPDNLIKAMTLISTRPFNSVDGTFFVDGLAGDGMNFFKNVLGLTDQKIEQKRNAAINFLNKRFGIDVNDPKVYFTGFQITPDNDYRVLMMTGENKNLGKGYSVIDGGYAVFVTAPEGLDLGGEFAGTHVPVGTMFTAGGTYVIKRGENQKDILITYQSRGPMQSVGTGGVFNCEVFHPKWGKGLGLGYWEFHNLKNGQFTSQLRNTLTFPGFGIEEGLIEQ